ncbi:hypothetical protein GCM10022403_045660 [Streptomyces coacervatus]|uniref:Insertion element IS402-like domain-containing protein n=1 Tax=Streptomyces coacervatus TaxID=647381 RepID=A0ABP7HZG3_9ACTN
MPDREVLCGILYVQHTGIQWAYLPQELGFRSGMTCWRRLRDCNEAGVRQRLHEVLLAELNAASRLDRSDSLFADRGYDHDNYRDQVRTRGIVPALARRGTRHATGLGTYRQNRLLPHHLPPGLAGSYRTLAVLPASEPRSGGQGLPTHGRSRPRSTVLAH